MQKFSQLSHAEKVVDFSYHGHALVTLYIQFVCSKGPKFDWWVLMENLGNICNLVPISPILLETWFPQSLFLLHHLDIWVPILGPLSPSSSLMNSVVLASRRCSLWTDLPRRPLCLKSYSTNKVIFSRNQSVDSCIGHFPLESCGWVIREEEHEKMQCKPSLRWDSHKVYSDVSEGWKWCDPYPPPPPRH